MSQPANERDIETTIRIVRMNGADTLPNPTNIYTDILQALAQARTEGAEAMRQAAVQLCKEQQLKSKAWQDKATGMKRSLHCATTMTWGEAADAIASLSTPEGDTTPTERGEESGDLLAECERVLYDISMQATRHTRAATDYNLLLRDLEFIEDKARALLARLPKGKEIPTP